MKSRFETERGKLLLKTQRKSGHVSLITSAINRDSSDRQKINTHRVSSFGTDKDGTYLLVFYELNQSCETHYSENSRFII